MAQIVMNSIMLSLLLVLFALGLSLIFGVMKIINFAHGEMYMLGAYGTWLLSNNWGLNFFVAVILSMIVVAAIGIILERYIIKPFRGDMLPAAIVTLGLLWILQSTMQIVGGGQTQGASFPPAFHGSVSIAGASISIERVVVIFIAIIFMVLLLFVLNKSKIGRSMRAAAQNPDAALLMGVNIDRVASYAMGIGCAMAAAGGGLAGGLFFINPYMGGPQLMRGFVIIIVGGMGSIPGTIAASIIVGFIDSFATTFLGSNIAGMLVFLVAIVVLLLRPRGLLGIEDF